METDVLHENKIGRCEPEAGTVDIISVFYKACCGCCVGGVVQEGALFSTDVLASNAEGAKFLHVVVAECEACCPCLRIVLVIGVLVVVAEDVDIFSHAGSKACAPDACIILVFALDVFRIISQTSAPAVYAGNRWLFLLSYLLCQGFRQ